MSKSDISVGDKVLRCNSWMPGVFVDKNEMGEGIVTLIINQKNGISMRVIWPSGIIKWHSMTELVNTKRIIRGIK